MGHIALDIDSEYVVLHATEISVKELVDVFRLIGALKE
jgi:hypothetical protein